MSQKIIFTTKLLLTQNRRNFQTIANMTKNLTKTEAKNILLKAKQESNLTFEQISNRLGVNKVWLTSAIYGEHPFDEELAVKTLELIGISERHNKEFREILNVMKEVPEIRGLNHESYATDPFIARLYEVVRVYGPAFKALVTEECGNGIVSAIDCELQCDKYVDKSTDSERVVIKIDGKFLKYKN